MLALLVLIPVLPLAGSLILGFGGRRLSERAVAWIGVGSVVFAAVLALILGIDFALSARHGQIYIEPLWRWMSVGGFHPEFSLRLDALSLIMMIVVTFVSALIHLYSTEFMQGDDGYSRFFCYMNLFVASMLVLVLAENLLFLYLGWEGVGLCSYLLIGFWYRNPENGLAARKAFVVTRVGDTAMLIGFFVLYWNLGTLDVATVVSRAHQLWPVGSGVAELVAALLLGGAIGKSAQLPLQTWLPDAMAGPTPVSALIHAATMVTAGVYLIARMHVLFALAPPVQEAVAIIGAVTLLAAGFSALTQRDIKRILAYSTMSQIGYMFLALGVGAWSAAIFHFMTHAFFKALLFLAAGAVIQALHEEHDIFKMGGLRRSIPWVFWTFLIGAASLAALPWVTAGYYSKDLILSSTYLSPQGSAVLWGAGLVGAVLTSLYSFRMVFVAFFGEAKSDVIHKPGIRILIPLLVLAVLSIGGGFVNLPGFLSSVLPVVPFPKAATANPWCAGLAGAASVLGLLLAYFIYQKRPSRLARLAEAVAMTGWGISLQRLWFSDWGFDWIYDRIFVRPLNRVSTLISGDFVDLPFRFVAWLSRQGNRMFSALQSGKLRWYAWAIAGGAVLLVLLAEVL